MQMSLGDAGLFAAMMFLFGLGVGLYQANLWTTTFEVVDPAARSTAIGLLNVASGMLGSWATPVCNCLRESHVIHLALPGIDHRKSTLSVPLNCGLSRSM